MVELLLIGVLLALGVNIYYLIKLLKIQQHKTFSEISLDYLLHKIPEEQLKSIGMYVVKERDDNNG